MMETEAGGTSEPQTDENVKSVTTYSNWFGISDNTLGIIMLLVASFVAAIDSIMIDIVEEDDYVSANAMTLYASIATFGASVVVDAYWWYVGYGDGIHWFVFLDIWREKQRRKFMDIPKLWSWTLISTALMWFITFLILASFVYVSNVGDAIALYDAYPIFVPIFGLCFATGEDWRHRYMVSLVLVIGGVILIAQPGFIFGYDDDVDSKEQLYGCIFAFLSSVLTAFSMVAWVMIKKLTYLDLLHQQQQKQGFNEESPLIDTPLVSGGTAGDASASSAGSNQSKSQNKNNKQMATIDDAEDSGYLSGGSDVRSTADVENAFSGDEDDLDNAITNMMGELENQQYNYQSNEYIIQNDWAFTTLFVEYYSLVLILECLIFSPLKNTQGTTDTQWFWDEFSLQIDYDWCDTKCQWYIFGGAIFWWLDSYLYAYGTFKVINAPLASIIDISDIAFTFILSYFWLDEVPDSKEWGGGILVVLAILICVYPFEKHFKGTKWYDILKKF